MRGWELLGDSECLHVLIYWFIIGVLWIVVVGSAPSIMDL